MPASEYVMMSISDNMGYAPDQIENTITLGDLLEAVQNAIEGYGEDAKIVLANGQRYGAGYGGISAWEDIFFTEDDEDEYL